MNFIFSTEELSFFQFMVIREPPSQQKQVKCYHLVHVYLSNDPFCSNFLISWPFFHSFFIHWDYSSGYFSQGCLVLLYLMLMLPRVACDISQLTYLKVFDPLRLQPVMYFLTGFSLFVGILFLVHSASSGSFDFLRFFLIHNIFSSLHCCPSVLTYYKGCFPFLTSPFWHIILDQNSSSEVSSASFLCSFDKASFIMSKPD